MHAFVRAARAFLTAWVGLALLTTLAACSRAETPRPTVVPVTLRIAADDTALPLMQRLAEAYTALNDNVTVRVFPSQPAVFTQLLTAGQIDLVATSRLVEPPNGSAPFWVGDLAMDGVAIIVNAQNPVSSLTLQDVRDIFSGIRGEWRDFGIEGRGIIAVLVRDDGDGTRVAFDKVVMGQMGLTKSGIVLPTAETVINYAALQPDAIGYIPASRLVGLPPTVKPVQIEGQLPTTEALISGNYRLVHTLNVVSASEPQGELRQFLAWALGADGQKMVAGMNFVPTGDIR